MDTLHYAQQYRAVNKFSIIPVDGKKPAISWKQYQHKQAAEDDIDKWFAVNGKNIGIITGKISNLVVVDLDPGYEESFLEKLPKTKIVRTGRNGYHFWFRYPDNGEIKNTAGFRPHCDIRAEGGYVVAPPSIHENGNQYNFATDHPKWTEEIAALPDWLLNELLVRKTTIAAIPTNEAKTSDNEIFDTESWPDNIGLIINGVNEGQRNNAATSMAGFILQGLLQHEWELFGWQKLQDWNSRNNPPLPDNELRRTFDSIVRLESAQRAKEDFELLSIQHRNMSKSLTWPIINGFDLINMEFPESDFMIDKLMPNGGICMIAGEPNSHKSWIMMEIAKQVSVGGCLFAKYNCKKTKVLYVDFEVPFAEIKRRWIKLNDVPGENVGFMSLPEMKLDSDKDLTELLKTVHKGQYGLVILDSLRDVWSGDENSSQAAQGIMEAIAKLLKIGCTVIVSHHKPRPAIGGASHAIRGSTVFEAKSDSILVIKKSRETESLHEIIIEQTKLREGMKLPEFSVGMSEIDNRISFEFMGEITKEESAEIKACAAIKDLLTKHGPMYEKQIVGNLQNIGHSSATTRRALKSMKDEGELIFDHDGPKNSKYYRLANSTSANEPLLTPAGYQFQ